MNDLPMSRSRAQKLARWLKSNYGPRLTAALSPTPFSIDIACAIVCKETGIYLVDFIESMTPVTALARCVFDASGDAPGTSRRAFPVNAAAFRAAFGDGFTDQLIDEANKTREARGMGPARYLYKGYGLFQYDLQHVKSDEIFFRNKLWSDFDQCLSRLVRELTTKFARTEELWAAIQAYNGSGPAAVVYRTHVQQLTEFCAAT